MAVDSLTPDDPRVKHHFLDIDDGITYHYMLARPQVEPASTVLLLHGW
jgi:soluble epoxide hydrolase / lipid-phosphate phosphatase